MLGLIVVVLVMVHFFWAARTVGRNPWGWTIIGFCSFIVPYLITKYLVAAVAFSSSRDSDTVVVVGVVSFVLSVGAGIISSVLVFKRFLRIRLRMSKSLLILLAVLVLLVVVYLLVISGEQRELVPEVTSNFLAIDSGAVNRIVSKRFGSEMTFVQRSDGWYVEDGDKLRRAQPDAVGAVVQLAYNLAVGEVVSSNPSKQLLFQVDTLTGVRVEFYRDEDYLAGLVVGKMSNDYQTTYVRKPESNDVYAALGPFSQLFSRPPSSFMDKTLLALDPGAINVVEFHGRGTDYSLLQQDTVWKVLPVEGESFVGDQTRLQRTVSGFANLQFSEFPAAPDSLAVDFSQPDLQITIGVRDGSEHTLRFVEQGGESKNLYVVRDDDPEPFIVFDYIVTNMVPRLEELRPAIAE